MTDPVSLQRRRLRGRLTLIALFALFFGSVVGAGALRFSGWQPPGLKNRGELLQPAVDVRALPPPLAGGGRYDWVQPTRPWRVLVVPAPGCAQACLALAADLDRVWRSFGHRAGDVHVLWLGEPPAGAPRPDTLRVLAPDPALRARLPRAVDPAGTPVYVVDPNGFVILRYAPGFDPADLRADLARLLQLI
ncbi:MAG: hypothetical protein QM805_16845 [Pseudomonas sp.]